MLPAMIMANNPRSRVYMWKKPFAKLKTYSRVVRMWDYAGNQWPR